MSISLTSGGSGCWEWRSIQTIWLKYLKWKNIYYYFFIYKIINYYELWIKNFPSYFSQFFFVLSSIRLDK